MNEFCQVAYSNDSEVTLDKAYEFLSRLKGWFDSLSDPLLPRTVVLPAHLQIQYVSLFSSHGYPFNISLSIQLTSIDNSIYYYHLILAIFEPLLGTPAPNYPSPPQLPISTPNCRRRL